MNPNIAQSLQFRSLENVFNRFGCLKDNAIKSKAEQEWQDHVYWTTQVMD